MADASLEAKPARENGFAEIQRLGLEIQTECRLVASLASAIDRELDAKGDPLVSEGRILNFLGLLEAAAERAGAMGEKIEIAGLQGLKSSDDRRKGL